MPVTAAALFTTAIKTTPWQNPDRENYFSSRLYYTYQLIIGRKFSEGFSLQISPTVVHRNLVKNSIEKNDVYSVAAAGRVKLTKRMAINAEYIFVPKNQLAPGYRNSFSRGSGFRRPRSPDRLWGESWRTPPRSLRKAPSGSWE